MLAQSPLGSAQLGNPQKLLALSLSKGDVETAQASRERPAFAKIAAGKAKVSFFCALKYFVPGHPIKKSTDSRFFDLGRNLINEVKPGLRSKKLKKFFQFKARLLDDVF